MATTDSGGDASPTPPPMLTVAAVARRLGVAPSTLRTWDRRYGLGPSAHTAGSHRRYSATDLARLVVMRRLTLEGVPPAEAARSPWPARPRASAARAPPVGRADRGRRPDELSGHGTGEPVRPPALSQRHAVRPPVEARRPRVLGIAGPARTAWPVAGPVGAAGRRRGPPLPCSAAGAPAAAGSSRCPTAAPPARGLARAAMSLDTAEVHPAAARRDPRARRP